jgi:hypothetical protein
VSQLARHIATVVVIALGVPIALFAGVNLSCAGTGMSPQCAGEGLLLSPLLLLVSGVIAAFFARGPLGFVLGAIGIAIGMVLLWIVAAVQGTTIPIDPAQALVATIWFGLPSVIGYSVTRGVMWVVDRALGRTPPPSDASAASMGEGI